MFNIGSRVRYTGDNKKLHNQLGTICCDGYPAIGIRFDNPIGLHSCDGRCKNPHGYWVTPKYLKVELKNNAKIR